MTGDTRHNVVTAMLAANRITVRMEAVAAGSRSDCMAIQTEKAVRSAISRIVGSQTVIRSG